jgi:hypothetical protein
LISSARTPTNTGSSSETYPFVCWSSGRFRVLANGDRRTESVDTLVIGSARWTYKPGTVVTRRAGRNSDDEHSNAREFSPTTSSSRIIVSITAASRPLMASISLRVDFTVASHQDPTSAARCTSTRDLSDSPLVFACRRFVGLAGLAETER